MNDDNWKHNKSLSCTMRRTLNNLSHDGETHTQGSNTSKEFDNKKQPLKINKDICNNCGKYGHLFRHCKNPIVSFGCVQFRINNNNIREYLMICRKDTLGYIDFIRGKYLVQDDEYIINMFKQMTNIEKERIMEQNFDKLWTNLWQNTLPTTTSLYKTEEESSRAKFNKIKGKIRKFIESSNKFGTWDIPEWGFPKGRRNYLEGEYDCAIRETVEETGFNVDDILTIKNIAPFEEVFIGSNYKNYKHKYYLTFMNFDKTTNVKKFDESEVSLMEWKTYDDCIKSIRPYNIDKINMISRIDNALQKYWVQ